MTLPDVESNRWPFPDPRVAGVLEHYARTQYFLMLAEKCPDAAGTYRLLLAGIYFARGVVELMFEAAEKEQLKADRAELKTRLAKEIPWFNLVEKIRIHDFHRFGLLPPDSQMASLFMGGPIKLKAKGGAAVLQILPSGPKMTTTGDSVIKQQRPLCNQQGEFWDEETTQYVSLERILQDFIKEAPRSIEWFRAEVDAHK